MTAFRKTARALITDPEQRILLLRMHDAVPLSAADPVTDYWITVGGGVEHGESFEAAMVREILEETGHSISDPGSCIWRRRKSLTDAEGVTRAADERYFWCPVPSADLSDAGWSPQEHLLIRECRWWSVDDPGLREIRIFPEGFLDAVHDLLRDGRPTEPRRLSP